MNGAELFFIAFAGLAVLSAVATMTRRNPVVAAVWLVATFFCVAVCYILLSATFLAAIQVLVYAGAMMVLFVFVIMVLDVDEHGAAEHRRPGRIGRWGYYALAGVGGLFLAWVMLGTLSRQFVTPGSEAVVEHFGSAENIGRSLFTTGLFAFESVSLLLLAAVIGAVVVARSRREREKEAHASGMAPEAMHAAGLSARDDLTGGAWSPGVTPEQARGPTPYTDFGQPSASGHDGGT